MLTFVKEGTNVVAARLGAVVSIVKLSTERLSLVKPLALEVTLILQLEWVPSSRPPPLGFLKAIVLLSAFAEVTELLQSPL